MADELAELGKRSDREGIGLVAAATVVARRVRSMKNVAEFEPLSNEFDGGSTSERTGGQSRLPANEPWDPALHAHPVERSSPTGRPCCSNYGTPVTRMRLQRYSAAGSIC